MTTPISDQLPWEDRIPKGYDDRDQGLGMGHVSTVKTQVVHTRPARPLKDSASIQHIVSAYFSEKGSAAIRAVGKTLLINQNAFNKDEIRDLEINCLRQGIALKQLSGPVNFFYDNIKEQVDAYLVSKPSGSIKVEGKKIYINKKAFKELEIRNFRNQCISEDYELIEVDGPITGAEQRKPAPYKMFKNVLEIVDAYALTKPPGSIRMEGRRIFIDKQAFKDTNLAPFKAQCKKERYILVVIDNEPKPQKAIFKSTQEPVDANSLTKPHGSIKRES